MKRLSFWVWCVCVNVLFFHQSVLAQLYATRANLSFGSVVVSTSRTDSFYVKNPTPTGYVLTAISNASGAFEVSANVGQIVSDSMVVRVTFRPVSIGVISDTVLIGHTGSSPNPIRVPLSGNGSSGVVIVSPRTGLVLTALSMVDTLTTRIRSDSVTIRNDSPEALTVTGLTLHNPEFSIQTPTPFTIAPSDSQRVRITYQGAFVGRDIDTLLVTHNLSLIGSSPIVLAVTARAVSHLRFGTMSGTTPTRYFDNSDTLRISGASAGTAGGSLFPAVPIDSSRAGTVALMNSIDTVAVRIDSITFTGPHFYSKTPTPYVQRPGDGYNRNIAFVYRPRDLSALHRDTLVVYTNDAIPGGNRITLLVEGASRRAVYVRSARRQATINFGTVGLGVALDSAVRVYNYQDISLRIDSVCLAQKNPKFQITSPVTGVTLGRSDSLQFNLRFIANDTLPSTSSTIVDTILVYSDYALAPLGLPLAAKVSSSVFFAPSGASIGLGSLTVGLSKDTSIKVFNRTNVMVRIDSVSLYARAAFAVLSPAPMTLIGPGDSSLVSIRFAPGNPWVFQDTLYIWHNFAALSISSPRKIVLSGTGITQVMPNPQNYFTVDNVEGLQGFPTANADSTYYEEGPFWQNLNVNDFGGTVSGHRRSPNLSGVPSGSAANFVFSLPDSGIYIVYHHLNTSVNATRNAFLRVKRNSDGAVLAVSRVDLQSISSGWFPLSVARMPAGNRAVTVTIGADDSTTPFLRVDAVRLVKSTNAIDLEFGLRDRDSFLRKSDPYVFPETFVGMPSILTVPLLNYGTQDVIITAISITSDVVRLKNAAFPITIHPGDKYDLLIEFSPARDESIGPQVKIYSNDPEEPEASFTLSCVGFRYGFVLNASAGGLEPHYQAPAPPQVATIPRYRESSNGSWLNSTRAVAKYQTSEANYNSRVNIGDGSSLPHSAFYEFELPPGKEGRYILEYGGPVGSSNAYSNVLVRVTHLFGVPPDSVSFNSTTVGLAPPYWKQIGGSPKTFYLASGVPITIEFTRNARTEAEGGVGFLRADLLRIRFASELNATASNVQMLFSRAVAGSADYDIYRMRGDSLNPALLYDDAGGAQRARWSPDRSKIVFHSDASSTSKQEVFLMNADGTGKQQLTANGDRWGSNYAHFRSTTKIWFTRGPTDGVSELYEMNYDGTAQTPLTNFQLQGKQICFFDFNDTRPILYYSKQSASSSPTQELYSANIDLSGELQLTANGVIDMDPRISPDGTRIAFVRSESASGYDPPFNVYVMNVDGSGATKLTNVTGARYCQNPVWYPDGVKLAYSYHDGTQWDIHVMNPDGSSVQNLTNSPTYDELISDAALLGVPANPTPHLVRSAGVKGTWGVATTWMGGVVPSLTDTVVIADGDTVTLDVSTEIAKLKVGEGVSGTLMVSNTTPIEIIVKGDVLVSTGASFVCRNPLSSSIIDTLFVYGDLINNGYAFDMRGGSAPNYIVCNIAFVGSSSSILKSTGHYAGSTNEFNGLLINKSGGARVVLGSDISLNTGSSAYPESYPILDLRNGIVETGPYRLIHRSTASFSVTSGFSTSYILGALGRGMSTSSGSLKEFPIGDSAGYCPIRIHSTTAGVATGHAIQARVVRANPNPGFSTLIGGINKVSAIRYYAISYDQGDNGSAAPTMSLDRFVLSYGEQDGVSAGNSNLRVAYSPDSLATWKGLGQTVPDTTRFTDPPSFWTPDSLAGGSWITLASRSASVFVALARLVGTYDNPLGGPSALPSSWAFTENTGNNGTIAVPTAINPTTGTRALQTGDAVGVFFTRNDSLICAGYSLWQDGQNMAITAWGDNDQTAMKDGFASGELIRYKIWDAQACKELGAVVQYQTGGTTYLSNGIYMLSSLVGYASIAHGIRLPQGWNMISSFVAPKDSTLDSVFVKIKPRMVIAKNGGGKVYWPALSINTIGKWRSKDGYQLYMQSTDTLTVTGDEITPQQVPLIMSQGWSLVSYLRNGPMRSDSAVTTLGGSLVIMKNGAGQVYWPALSINTIGSMKPGQGYQLYLSSGATLTYPANVVSSPPSVLTKTSIVAETQQEMLPEHYKVEKTETGSNATLVVKGLELKDGDEVGVKGVNGKLVGSGVVRGNRAVMTVWGDNSLTEEEKEGAAEGESLVLAVWSRSGNKERSVTITSLTNGLTGQKVSKNLTYVTDGAWEVEIGEVKQIPTVFSLEQNYPNPFNPSTIIRYGIPKDVRVSLEVYNMLGQKIMTLVDSEQKAGYYEVMFQANNISSGVYFYTLNSGEFRQTKKLMLLR